MSPRVLHFASYELTWECKQVACCECGSSKQRPSSPKEDYARYFKLVDPCRSDLAWIRLVADHSVLDMSNERDILPSVSGFAKQRLSTPSHLGDEYLAGLWKSTLVDHR